MHNMLKAFAAVVAVAAIGTVGCERNDYDRTANRTERTAERTENDMERAGDRTEDRLDQAGKDIKAGTKDAMADLRDGGIPYEVHRIDKEAQKVELRRADNKIGTAEDKELQAGMDAMTLSFMELEQYVEGDKKGEEIADELHDGENVHVFFDTNKKVKKITY